jgi:CRP-like cAMP-binding protein
MADTTPAAPAKLFELLDPDGRAELAATARPAHFAPGETIVAEGDVGEAFFLIERGSVRVLVDDHGAERELARLGTGAVFGEIAALTGSPRIASVVADGPVEALRFEGEALAVLRQHPRVLSLLNRVGLMRSEDTVAQLMGD